MIRTIVQLYRINAVANSISLESLELGGETFTIRAVIASEPDRIVNTFSFGPRAMMSETALKNTSLMQPGSLVRYRYRVALPEGTHPETWATQLEERFPDAAWRIRDFTAAAPTVERVLDNLTLFLTLTGLTALLAGGVGISNSVNALMQRKFFTIATLKSIGATNGVIMGYYVLLILLATSLAILFALGAALLIAWQAVVFINEVMEFGTVFAVHAAPLIQAACFGLLIALTFSLWQLGKIRTIKPAAIFRGKLGLEGWPSPAIIGLNIVLGVVLIFFAIAQNQTVAIIYVISTLLTIGVFALCSGALVQFTAKLRPKQFWARHGFANLRRPGARTLPSIISLGIGLTFLVGISLIDANIQRSIREIRPQDAPTHFFIDIQPSQKAAFTQTLTSLEATGIDMASMLRGNIVSLNDVPIAEWEVDSDVRWATRGDRGISDAARPPKDTRIVAGEWWPEDYTGPPLVSFDQRLAEGMRLKVGDTMTYNILGTPITAMIANLRDVNYQNFRMNFSIILSPGVLDGLPRSFIATANLPPESNILNVLAERFPNISPIAVDRAVAQVSELTNDLAIAIRVTAIFTVLAAIIVLIGALVANEERRIYDIIVLKVLGATRRDIIKTYLVEYASIGLIAGGISVLAGTAISWYVIDEFRFFSFHLMPGVSLGIMGVSLLAILTIGIAITLRSFTQKPLHYLRNE